MKIFLFLATILTITHYSFYENNKDTELCVCSLKKLEWFPGYDSTELKVLWEYMVGDSITIDNKKYVEVKLDWGYNNDPFLGEEDISGYIRKKDNKVYFLSNYYNVKEVVESQKPVFTINGDVSREFVLFDFKPHYPIYIYHVGAIKSSFLFLKEKVKKNDKIYYTYEAKPTDLKIRISDSMRLDMISITVDQFGEIYSIVLKDQSGNEFLCER
ncbi:MAG: hypothetical protein RI562_11775 [Salibacter sp.]|uniref:hypothetical protein n=1 Tax=Salibacter sp. TaxID=2010995 RepID=UPI0028707B95|nr:hypothetical protein [Salibacter sp.]MDR9399732.1 hypothetical protein [Salibacter sp.]